ncbi:Aste57867_3609 [Aphanomyces stellatus]|uniref:Aste57867_3609 protein n=1 Tax=Aphanomyces stellatus TaxID=120398 RepID=A0A485KEH2_9STRA|nr:hypothetical protein As57867_003598 [Aphanomyces stellatus]VFT80770.1 Aste57867_3609 [Aphanomyces stellatus]
MYQLSLFGQQRKGTVVVGEKHRWRVVLDNIAVVQDQNAVAVDDRVQPMGDREHGHVLETLFDGLLDEAIGLQVNVGRGFVQDNHAAVAEECAGDAEQLPLAHREVASLLGHLEFQSIDGIGQVHLLEHTPEIVI